MVLPWVKDTLSVALFSILFSAVPSPEKQIQK
jgi:hypothetical protein